jgi:integrase/recombinase XerD
MRLSEAIDRYLRLKRANGVAYVTEEDDLSAFCRLVDNAPIGEVTPKQVTEFLNNGNPCNSRWMQKHSCLRKFFEFWTDRGQLSALSMPEPKRRTGNRLSAPFIYTRTELRTLFQATLGNQTHGRCAVSDATFRAILVTLYGTGATTSEILRIRRDGLDLKRNLVFLRGDRVILPRRVPIGQDLHEELGAYLRSDERRGATSEYVFVSKQGGPIGLKSMSRPFARLRTRAGIVRLGAEGHQPRMCDFRAAFAVHRISYWLKQDADLNQLLPALSAYMGFTGFSASQRFLLMTPERFNRELDALSPYKARKHWRDDPALMRFLASL